MIKILMNHLYIYGFILLLSHPLNASQRDEDKCLDSSCRSNHSTVSQAEEKWIEFEPSTATVPEVLKRLELQANTTHLALKMQYFGDTEFASIADSPYIQNVQGLYLAVNCITDNSVGSLKKFSRLGELNLSQNPLTPKGLSLIPLENIENLYINFIKFDAESLDRLLSAEKLKELYMAGTGLNDDFLPILTKFKNLKILDISHNSFSTQALDELSTQLSSVKIIK